MYEPHRFAQSLGNRPKSSPSPLLLAALLKRTLASYFTLGQCNLPIDFHQILQKEAGAAVDEPK